MNVRITDEATDGEDSSLHPFEAESRSSGDQANTSTIASPFRRTAAIVGITATLATVLATLAGILFSLEKSRSDDHQFQLNLVKEETTQKLASEASAKAEGQRMKDALEQSKVQEGIARLELQEAQEKIAAEKLERERDRLSSDSLRLGEAIRRIQKEDSPPEAEVSIISEFLNGHENLSSVGLQALSSRLEGSRTASEIRSIFEVLPLAGQAALPVEIHANRIAAKNAERMISGEVAWRLLHSTSGFLPSLVTFNLGDELIGDRPLSKYAAHDLSLYPESVAWYHGITTPGEIETRAMVEDYIKGHPDFDYESIHKDYPAWEASLQGSLEAIEKTLSNIDQIDTLNLNRCFLPSFRITHRIRVNRLRLIEAYVVGADLRNIRGPVVIEIADARFDLDPYAEFVNKHYNDQFTSSSTESPSERITKKSLETYEIKLPAGSTIAPPAKRDTINKPLE
jgi:hypothetical protein